MAKKGKRKGRKGHHGRKPTARAKKAYIANVHKSFRRLAKVVKKHDPAEFESVVRSTVRG
jgi:hypothetical protein